MILTLKTEQEMLDFGHRLAGFLTNSNIRLLELVGDVGTGKTTITRGLAAGLGVSDPVTSPSFTISKVYATTVPAINTLVHYDFYRLDDPGIMQEDLAENLADPATLTVIEWGGSVADVLPEDHLKLQIHLNDDGSRTIEADLPAELATPSASEETHA